MTRDFRVAAAPLLLTACSGVQSAVHPTGDQAKITVDLLLFFLAITATAYLLVIGFLAWGLARRNRDNGEENGLRTALWSWSAFVTIGLLALALASYFADRSFATAGQQQAPVRVKVSGHMWWWEVEYRDAGSGQVRFRTANELHLPVDRPATVELASGNVVHSLWIPNLAGKEDLIPGRSTELRLLPRKVGRFRGQCGEFCGLQHANMALDVIVEPPALFAAWLQRSAKPASPRANGLGQVGFDLFMQHCATCHTVAGTPASGTNGPDLTHVASRFSIAAGVMPNGRQELRSWISDPQSLKPGAQMPAQRLNDRELDALVAYLETLS